MTNSFSKEERRYQEVHEFYPVEHPVPALCLLYNQGIFPSIVFLCFLSPFVTNGITEGFTNFYIYHD